MPEPQMGPPVKPEGERFVVTSGNILPLSLRLDPGIQSALQDVTA